MKKKGIVIFLVIGILLVAATVGVWKYRQVQAEETATQSTEIVLGENQTLEEVQIKTINGNEMTYERNGETVTTLIPVGTTVTTKLGTTTTFSRLSPGNTIQMVLEDGEIVSIQIVQ